MLLSAATVAAVLLLATASWGQEATPEEGKKTPDLTVGDDKGKAPGKAAKPEEAEGEKKPEAEDVTKKRIEALEKQVIDLQKQLEAAKKPAPAAPAKAAPKKVAKKQITKAPRPRGTDKNDPQAREAIRALRIQLARLEGRQEGADDDRRRIFVSVLNGATISPSATATANGKAKAHAPGGAGQAEPGTVTKKGSSKTEEPKEKPSTKNGEKKDPPKKADDPKPEAPKNGAEGKGKTPAQPEEKKSEGKVQEEEGKKTTKRYVFFNNMSLR